MPLYDVRFEDVGFLSDPEGSEAELTAQEAAGFTETALAEGLFPEGVVAVVSGSVSPDDSVYEDGVDEEGDCKVFVSIVLRIEADDEYEAEQIKTPEELLTKLTDMMNPDIDLERDWEVLESEEVEISEPTPA